MCLVDLIGSGAWLLPTSCMECGIDMGTVLFTELESPSGAASSDHEGYVHRVFPSAV